MQQNFLFYDTETSDRDPFFGQIFQLAAVLTDADLNPIDSFDIRSKRLPQILPSPGALLVNGLDPASLDQAPYTNYEFAGEVRRRFMAWTPAITCGYNSFGFDEKCLRSLFYQNLYPPYITQLDGNSRIDILPLTQATEILYPDALVFPLNDKGKTSKKLEHVAPANGFEEHNAHDALGDVEATIHVARLIKARAPVLWQAALAARTKRDATARATRQPLIYVQSRSTLFPAMLIGRVHNGRDLLVADLRFDAPDIASTSPNKLFKGPDQYCRVIKPGEAPLIFSQEEFSAMPHGLSWDASDIEARMRAWQAIKAEEHVPAMHAEWQTPFEPAEHPEGAIYENFPAFDQDAAAMRAFHDAAPAEKPQAMERLTDKRFRSFAKRIIFDNFPELITDADKAAYDRAIAERLNREDDVPWVTVAKALEDGAKLLASNPDRRDEIDRITAFIRTMAS